MPESVSTGSDVIGHLPWGTHFCHFYETQSDLLDIVVPYFKAGLEANEFCVWIVCEPLTLEDAISSLRRTLPDADKYLTSRSLELVAGPGSHDPRKEAPRLNSLEIVSNTDWYLTDSSFNARLVINAWRKKLDESLANGFSGLRVSANVAWLTKEEWEDFRSYEEALDESLEGQQMIVLCSYPVSSASALEILDVARTHSLAVVKRNNVLEVLETPGFSRPMPPVFFASPAPQMISQLSDGRWIEVNRAFVELLGYQRTELIGRTSLELGMWVSPEERTNLSMMLRERGSASGYEGRIKTKSGRILDVVVFVVPIRLENKDCLLATFFDITKRKSIEHQLRNAEEEAHKVLDTIPQQIWSGPGDGTIDYVNYQWRAYTGLGFEELHDNGWQRMLHPEEKERVVQAWNHAVANGTPYEQEERHRRFDGVYHWFLAQGVPLRDSEGRIARWYGSNTDIDDYKQAEEALRRNEDRIRLIIETIPVMAWTTDVDGIVDFLNQRWMDYAGLSVEEYVKDPTGPIHPEDTPRVMEKWLADKALGKEYEDEMRLRRADGEYRWFLVRTAPLRDESGNVVKWYGVSTDIDDRKRTEESLETTTEQLRALSRRFQMAKEEEAIRIARELHDELGSALTLLKWDLARLEKERELPRNQISKMDELIDKTITSVRRISAELRPNILDDLGPIPAMQSYLAQFQERSGIRTRFQTALNEVALPPTQSIALFRIFQEALTNVLRHAGATEVVVEMRQDDRNFILTVTDNGRGITEAEKSDAMSLGILGMKERALLILGEIDVSNPKDGGTTITVTVPVTP